MTIGIAGQDARPIDQNHASSSLAGHHGTFPERRVCLIHRRDPRASEKRIYAGINCSFTLGTRFQASAITPSKCMIVVGSVVAL